MDNLLLGLAAGVMFNCASLITFAAPTRWEATGIGIALAAPFLIAGAWIGRWHWQNAAWFGLGAVAAIGLFWLWIALD
jgi:hypothetical protein